jgi:hypothetical protein
MDEFDFQRSHYGENGAALNEKLRAHVSEVEQVSVSEAVIN